MGVWGRWILTQVAWRMAFEMQLSKRAYWKGWRGKLSRVLNLVLWTFLVVALGLVALLIWSGLGVNKWIDLCADETSGRYIFDDATRRAKCE